MSTHANKPAPHVDPRPSGNRPPQTDFGDDLDYPRLGAVSFRRGTLTDNQEKTWEDNWPIFGKELSEDSSIIDAAEWFGRQAPLMVKGDGVEVLARMFAPESLDGIRIFFPDPWPKARHHKRRIIQSGPLNLIASRLKKGGVLHVATDHAGYAEWIDELVNVEPQLEFLGWPWPECPQLTDRQVITKFEGKGLDKDHTIREYLWRKR